MSVPAFSLCLAFVSEYTLTLHCVILIVWSVIQIGVVSPGVMLLLTLAAPLVEVSSRVGQAVVGGGRFKGRAVVHLDLRHVSASTVLTGQRLVHGHLGVNAVTVAVIVQAVVAA